MDAIRDIIPQVIAPLSQGKSTGMDLAASWKRLSGNPAGSCLASFKDGCVTVHLDSSARLVHMNARKGELLAKLAADHPQVKELKLKVGKIT